MSDVPENDALEREPAVEVAEVGLEVPEADALEQAQPAGAVPRPERPHLGLEVPEADALEQAEEVVDDDYEP